MSTLPATVELCQRPRELGRPCLGRIYRPQPDVIYCERCGGKEPGVVYAREDRPTDPPPIGRVATCAHVALIDMSSLQGHGKALYAACAACRGDAGPMPEDAA